MVFLTGIALGAETVKAKKAELVIMDVSARSKSVFIMWKNVRRREKLQRRFRRINADLRLSA